MGEIRKGILGGFSGKVGTVVGANWRGKDIMRSLPKRSQRAATEEQLIVRAKFRLVTKFITPISTLFKEYFGQPSNEKSRRNLAVSYHIREAVAGVFPDFTIDYPKVVVTKGELPGLQEPLVTPVVDAKLDITWEDNSTQGLAKPGDFMLALVYNEEKNLYHYQMTALRSALTYQLVLDQSWTGDTVQCWLSFIAADGKNQSTSMHLGAIVLL